MFLIYYYLCRCMNQYLYVRIYECVSVGTRVYVRLYESVCVFVHMVRGAVH